MLHSLIVINKYFDNIRLYSGVVLTKVKWMITKSTAICLKVQNILFLSMWYTPQNMCTLYLFRQQPFYRFWGSVAFFLIYLFYLCVCSIVFCFYLVFCYYYSCRQINCSGRCKKILFWPCIFQIFFYWKKNTDLYQCSKKT